MIEPRTKFLICLASACAVAWIMLMWKFREQRIRGEIREMRRGKDFELIEPEDLDE